MRPDKQATPNDLASVWGSLPRNDIAQILDIVGMYIQAHNDDERVANKISKHEARDILQVVGVYLDVFNTLDAQDGKVTHADLLQLVSGPQVQIDLCNQTWRNSLQYSCRPIISNCLQMVSQTSTILSLAMIPDTPEETKTELLEQAWATAIRRYDFVSWILFAVTANSDYWAACHLAVAKLSQKHNLESFIKAVSN